MFNNFKNQKGFTLLEVMVTTVILAVGLLGLLGMQITTIKGNSFSYQMTIAVSLAKNTMEGLSMLDYDDPKLSTITNPHTDPNNPMDALGQSGGIYTREWVVRENPARNMKTITVTVSWTSIFGREPRVRLRTIKVR